MSDKNSLTLILAILTKVRDNQFLAKELNVVELHQAIIWLNAYLKKID